MPRKLAAIDGNEALIRVVGVGGAGGNAINSMIRSGIYGVEFIALNTDAQDLIHSDAPNRLRLGEQSTKGLGAGGDAFAALAAAEESEAEIRALLEGSDMVFVTAGMGGGTGSGAAPVVARIAREMGALTVGVVTTPFSFEGSNRRNTAIDSVEKMRVHTDALITIQNDRLRAIVGEQTPLVEAFAIADDVLRQGVQGISDIITIPGLVNLDFADVRAIMKNAGTALMGIGAANGENRAARALQAALNSPLLGQDISGATGILVNFAAGPSLSLAEVSEAAEQLTAAAASEANIIFGTSLDETRGDEVMVTVVATGFRDTPNRYNAAGYDAYATLDPYAEQATGSTWAVPTAPTWSALPSTPATPSYGATTSAASSTYSATTAAAPTYGASSYSSSISGATGYGAAVAADPNPSMTIGEAYSAAGVASSSYGATAHTPTYGATSAVPSYGAASAAPTYGAATATLSYGASSASPYAASSNYVGAHSTAATTAGSAYVAESLAPVETEKKPEPRNGLRIFESLFRRDGSGQADSENIDVPAYLRRK